MSQLCRIDPALVRRLQELLRIEGAVEVPAVDAQRLLWRAPQLVQAMGDAELPVHSLRFVLLDSWGKYLLGAQTSWPLSNATPEEAAEFWEKYLTALRSAGFKLVGVEE